MKQAALAILTLIGIPVICPAQLVNSRDQATGWYVPATVKVTLEGAKAKDLDVIIYKDNKQLQKLKVEKGRFTLNLDLDNAYTLVIQKAGYRNKSVYMDTHMPKDQVSYAAYQCTINLEAADKFTHADPFFLDFPGAIVRWDKQVQGFQPNAQYLADIQSKMGMLQAQMVP